MLSNTLFAFINQDLDKLYLEIESYEKEENLWKVEANILNSTGNLCLHLLGNLNFYIGSNLGNTGYIRERDLEFSKKDVPRAQLLDEIRETQLMLQKTLVGLPDSKMNENYPLEVFGHPMTHEYFFIHLATHLSYHLGQVNYHRRILDV
ncbi:hypothetical protein P872_08520 [Rhodonellum psychrophilum GCM71 = DSM 17998]|uniref:DinB superfamily protein n=2 Tax=Rhodonellum TaxID=336827 RepID=U5BW47_9BACT|nr:MULTISPECIES: DinB family protein [Rhodonellum]ERM82103.1 hypothetical protein P872_08520 [Rhodonellum psychrophilum GCM71 = DSM 17998]SDZ17776.1 Protein of unknown function [Rhodonellum ikkaensis]